MSSIQKASLFTQGGPLSYILVHTCINKKHVKRGLFFSRTRKHGTRQINSNSSACSHSNLFSSQIWNKCHIILVKGVIFVSYIKMRLGVYFKTIVHTCEHLHMWVAPLGLFILLYQSTAQNNEIALQSQKKPRFQMRKPNKNACVTGSESTENTWQETYHDGRTHFVQRAETRLRKGIIKWHNKRNHTGVAFFSITSLSSE